MERTPPENRPFKAGLSLGGPAGAPSMGETRARLLEAIGREGSISAAARAAGLSYKAAWDAVDAMNNLFGRPLVTAQTGGRKGGGATLTPEGALAVRTYRLLDAELARALRAAAPMLAAAGFPVAVDPQDAPAAGPAASGPASSGSGSPDSGSFDSGSSGLLFPGALALGAFSPDGRPGPTWPFMLRTSARNVLRAVTTATAAHGVTASVTLSLHENGETSGGETGGGATLTAVVTRDSLEALGLAPGRPCLALIKAPFVGFEAAPEAGGALPDDGLNRIRGATARRTDDETTTEIVLDVGGGKTLTGILPSAQADALKLAPGTPAVAVVDPNHVILAVT